MFRPVALFCAWLLLWPSLAPQAVAQGPKTAKPTLKEQVVLMAAGSVVEVELKSKEKLRGRLGTVTDTGFEMQHVKNDQTLNQTLRFDEVRKVKLKQQGMSTGAKIALGALAGIGGFFLIVLAVAAAYGWD